MRPVIIAIAGPSGSGKTHLSKYLRNEFEIPIIVSSTTRPLRKGERNGLDYFFVTSTKHYDRSAMLTHTRFGKHEYFSLKSQLPPDGYCSYVVDENGIKALKNARTEEYDVYTVWVSCNADTLAARGIDQERIDRDQARHQIDYSYIDLIIGNNGSIAQFEQAAHSLVKILEQWQHLR